MQSMETPLSCCLLCCVSTRVSTLLDELVTRYESENCCRLSPMHKFYSFSLHKLVLTTDNKITEMTQYGNKEIPFRYCVVCGRKSTFCIFCLFQGSREHASRRHH